MLLGVDAGTTGIKLGLFRENGKQVAFASQGYSLICISDRRIESDPDSYWKAFKAALASVLKKAKSQA